MANDRDLLKGNWSGVGLSTRETSSEFNEFVKGHMKSYYNCFAFCNQKIL